MKATFDTNVADRVDLLRVAHTAGFEAFVTSVTHRELLPSDIVPAPKQLVLETAVFDESQFGGSVFGSEKDAAVLEAVLAILSNGSFPRPGMREALTDGQKRQLRDAMIFSAHARQSHDLFITDDERAFIREGRREKLQKLAGGRIMTSSEFLREFGN
jgi:hypothetical protein